MVNTTKYLIFYISIIIIGSAIESVPKINSETKIWQKFVFYTYKTFCKFVNLRKMISCIVLEYFQLRYDDPTNRFVAIYFFIHTSIQKYISPQEKNNKKKKTRSSSYEQCTRCIAIFRHSQAQTPANSNKILAIACKIVNESAAWAQLSRIILSFCYDRIFSIMKFAAVYYAHSTAHSFYCFNYVENTCIWLNVICAINGVQLLTSYHRYHRIYIHNLQRKNTQINSAAIRN